MDADLQPVYERVMQAARPEDAFKELTVVLPPRILEKHLALEMESMRARLEPDAYLSTDDKDAARSARGTLEALYEEAIAKAAAGLYAIDAFSSAPLPSGGRLITVGEFKCSVGERIHIGANANVYKGRVNVRAGSGGIVLKVAHAPENNPHLFNEIRMLDLLHRKDVGYWRNVPYMLGRFTAGERVGIVERYFDGLTLTALRENRLHANGLDQRHMVWVMDRMLGLLWYMHTLGIVHGGINPDRIMIRPSNHNAVLTGWGHAVYRPAKTGERILPTREVFEAPEVASGGSIGPWTDIYSLGKTLIWLVGGNPDTNEVPQAVEPILQRFLRNMVRKSVRARPSDTFQLYEQQNKIKDSLWARQFVHLDLA